MNTFLGNGFMRKNIPTIEGVNSRKGNLHIMIAPTAKDKDKIRINIIVQDEVDEMYRTDICTLISADTAKMLAYQLMQTFDIPMTDEELKKANQMSEEYFSQFPTIDDLSSVPVLDVI